MSAFQSEVHRHGDTTPLPNECCLKPLKGGKYCFTYLDGSESDPFSYRDEGAAILMDVTLKQDIRQQPVVESFRMKRQKATRPTLPRLATAEDLEKLWTALAKLTSRRESE